ncbi:MAG: GtrA family protein [Arachnia sp.]
MSPVTGFLERHRSSLRQLLRFGVVGGLGVLVNMAALIGVRRGFPLLWATALPDNVFYDLPLTDYNIRWYHVMAMVAFLVANLFNFQLNRWWTFRSHRHASWLREYVPFLVVGLVSLAAGQIILTTLMHPGSAISLPVEIFDDSTGFRTRLYWANLIMIGCTVPVSFLLNKFWTFRSVRSSAMIHAVEDVVDSLQEA